MKGRNFLAFMNSLFKIGLAQWKKREQYALNST